MTDTLHIGAREVDLALGTVDGETLAPLEVGVLRALAEAAGDPVSRDTLARRVWGMDRAQGRAVDNVVVRLRTKLELDPARPRRLLTVRGGGYRLVSLEAREAPTSAAPSTSARRRLRLPIGVVDLDLGQVEGTAGSTSLTVLERKLFSYLLERVGQLVPKEQLLTDVWGWKPGLETRTIERAIQRFRQKIDVDPADPVVLLTDRGVGYRLVVPTGNASEPVGVLIGRRVEREEIERRFAAGARLVTLVGPGGAGKTRLARAYAVGVRDTCRLSGGAWFVDLSATRSAVEVAAATLATLGIAGRGSEVEGLLAAVGRSIATRGPIRLVLDNCEHLLTEIGREVARWLDDAPELTVLATSRTPLGLVGEAMVPLGPLPIDDAVELLRGRVTGAPDEAVLRAIASRVEGLPLALELAASRLTALSPEELLVRLRHPLDALGAGPTHASRRHLTLRDAIRWSWDLLLPEDREVMAAASVFLDGFDRAALQAVAAPEVAEQALLDTLERLVGSSLLEALADTHPRRYRMLMTVREFAAEALSRSDASDALVARHRTWFAEAAWRAVEQLSGSEPAQAHRFLSTNLANLLEAYGVAMRTDPNDACRLAGALARTDLPRSHAADLVSRALALEGADSDARLRCLRHLAQARLEVGRLDEAEALADQGIAEAMRAGQAALVPSMKATRALVYLQRGDFAACRALFVEAWALAEQAGSDAALAHTLYWGGVVLGMVDGDETTRDRLERALFHAERSGDVHTAIKVLEDLGQTHLGRGRVALASDTWTRARAAAERAGDPRVCDHIDHSLGWLALYEGRAPEAERVCRRAVAHYVQRGQPDRACTWQTRLATVLMELGRAAEATVLLAETLSLEQQIGVPARIGIAHRFVGVAWHLRGDAVEALRHLDRAIATLAASGPHPAWVTARVSRAAALADLDRLEEAESELSSLSSDVAAIDHPLLRQLVDVTRAHVDLCAAGDGPALDPSGFEPMAVRPSVRVYLAARARQRERAG